MTRNAKQSQALTGKHEWSGYTLSELRFQRAVTLVRMDIAAEKLHRSTRRFDANINAMRANNLLLSVLSNVSFAQYAALAVRTIRTVYRFWSSLRNR